jgi:putative flippase GtrA
MRQFVLFAGVGAVATAAQYATLLVMVELVGIYPLLASTVGLAVGVLTNYMLTYNVTFKSNAAHRDTLPKFLSISGFGLCINWGIMAAGSAWLGMHYLLLQVFSTAILLIFNYMASRLWVFRDKQHE